MIQLDRISRQFGPRLLFEGLSWKIQPRSRLGLVGANGSGKTTLLRILDGRDRPDGGSVHRAQRLQVGYLPQEVETVEQGSVLSVVLAGYAELSTLETEIEQVEHALASLRPDDAESERLTQRYGTLRERFEQLEGDRVEARAKAILSGLGIGPASFHEPLETLSGGWRMRAILARLLLGSPGLLLLDEPTNHLDLEAIAWLEGFLESYEGAFVVVSHDRYFLNRMVRGIVELERGKLTQFTGNYDAYLRDKEGREQALEKAAKQQARGLAQAERFIERFRYKNTKARQVQSRIRALDKVERVETERKTKTIRFGFPPAPRSGDIVVRAEGVDKAYGDVQVYRGLDLLLRRGARVALVGPNGAGKSTLLKLLSGRLRIDAGTLELGHNVAAAYYAQHQLDDLDPQATALEEMERVAPPEQRTRLRSMLGSFLFTGEDVDKKVQVLSGGEKARLALAKLLVRPANLLLLDEPTNHLDLRSREVLEQALDLHLGTMVVISHDRYFINRVATSIGNVDGGGVELYEGDYDAYLKQASRRIAESKEPAQAPKPRAVDARRSTKRQQAEQRNRLYREHKTIRDKLEALETRIAEVEANLRELERMQADPEVYSDPQRAAEAGQQKVETESLLEQLFEEWEELASSLPP